MAEEQRQTDAAQPPAPAAKALLRIGEVAALLGVPTHVIRFWQTEFPSLAPGRTGSGRFVYSAAQVEQLRRIQRLLHVERLTIAGARRALRSGKARALLGGDAGASASTATDGAADGATGLAPGAAGAGAPADPPAARAEAVTVSASGPSWPAGVSAAQVEALEAASLALRRSLEQLRERLEEC